MAFSNKYIVFFAACVCLVCSLIVSSLAVGLRERQDENRLFDKKQNILRVAGLVAATKPITKEDAETYFSQIETIVIDRKTGEMVPDIDAQEYDPEDAAKKGDTSVSTANALDGEDRALAKLASIKRLPDHLLAYHVKVPSKESYVLPIKGYGLWSTLYGFLCVAPDGQTIRGITYYEHGETPGLGGEVDNPRWKALWEGKKIYRDGEPEISVRKGGARNEYEVDGLSGATITSNGVTNMLHFWLGPEGYEKFLEKVREE